LLKHTKLVLSALAALPLVVFSATAPASASSSGATTHGKAPANAVVPLTDGANPGPMIDDATGRCLDSNANGVAYALPCSGNNYQNWQKIAFNGGYQFKDVQTGLCLAVVNVESSTLDGVGTASCGSSTTASLMTWDVTQLSSNIEKYTNVAEYPYVLDSDTDGEGSGVGSVYTDPWNGGAYQKWNYQ
jgi:Ricin-type beta-trefoil lectin domain